MHRSVNLPNLFSALHFSAHFSTRERIIDNDKGGDAADEEEEKATEEDEDEAFPKL